MMTMVERMSVAMAVCEMRRNGMSETLCTAASAHPETVAVALENYGPQARAALESIREPDEAVKAAGEAVLDLPEIEPLWCRRKNAGEGFTAMIDAILNQKAGAPNT